MEYAVLLKKAEYCFCPKFKDSCKGKRFGLYERMWRNWYTRTFEGRVALPCEFESRHPHRLQKVGYKKDRTA